MEQISLITALGSVAAALMGALGLLIYRACLGIAAIITAKQKRYKRRGALRRTSHRSQGREAPGKS